MSNKLKLHNMKKQFILSLILFVSISMGSIAQVAEDLKPEHLTVETFKAKVFNYEKNPEEWKFEGDIPCIIDFYADWCKPCKLVAPIMDELSEEYKGKVNIYKINTEQQRELSQMFGIKSIPTVLFVPMKGKPQMSTGALPKESYKQVIDEFLLGKKKDQ